MQIRKKINTSLFADQLERAQFVNSKKHILKLFASPSKIYIDWNLRIVTRKRFGWFTWSFVVFFKSKIYIYTINRLIVWIKFLRKVSPSLSFKYFLNISRAILFCILAHSMTLTHSFCLGDFIFWVKDSY